jgi:hypothetical protein
LVEVRLKVVLYTVDVGGCPIRSGAAVRKLGKRRKGREGEG